MWQGVAGAGAGGGRDRPLSGVVRSVANGVRPAYVAAMDSPNTSILVTGARGFMGRHLVLRLHELGYTRVRTYGRENTPEQLAEWAADADVVFHLAGVNRPDSEEEFEAGNVGFTEHLCAAVAAGGRRPLVVSTSSKQALRDTAYGRSKRRMEQVLAAFAVDSGARIVTFRVKNVFGKWSRPHYNSVVATFCHSIARDEPVTISDEAAEVDLAYVDDVIDVLIGSMASPPTTDDHGIAPDVTPSYRITLGDLAGRIRAFRDMQQTLRVPDMSDRFNVRLYSVFLSHLEPMRWSYSLDRREDERGDLAEFIKSDWFGQVFISRTRPGITRGNHYHHTKTEKFMVVAGEGLIRFRHVEGGEVIEFRVRGEEYRVVEIPPGLTHSITNVGNSEMITLFWASEVFDPQRPDTIFLPVDQAPPPGNQ
jgi:UDP-2-acetamido-2,6-beta-L-arabino-hexul-4-ose reductase